MGTLGVYSDPYRAPYRAPDPPPILKDFPRLPDNTTYVTRKMIEEDETVANIVRVTQRHWRTEFDMGILIYSPRKDQE